MIAIIAILAAMLLPALQNAKRYAQSAGCLSNIKQLQMAWLAYPCDYNDLLVANYHRGNYGDVPSYYSTSNSWVCGSALMDPTAAGLRRGALWRYTGSEGIYRCPSDKTLWPYGTGRAPRPWNFGLSIYMNGRWNDTVYSIPVKLAGIQRPGTSFTFIDMEETLPATGVFVLQEGQENFRWAVPGFRDRSDGASLAFADGHAEFHKWKYPNRRRKANETRIVNVPDREDLRWLLSRLPGAK